MNSSLRVETTNDDIPRRKLKWRKSREGRNECQHSGPDHWFAAAQNDRRLEMPMMSNANQNILVQLNFHVKTCRNLVRNFVCKFTKTRGGYSSARNPSKEQSAVLFMVFLNQFCWISIRHRFEGEVFLSEKHTKTVN